MKELKIEEDSDVLESIDFPDTYTSLSISKSRITHLSGLENFTNLDNLSIYYCRNLEDLSNISQLKKLKQLVLYSLPKHTQNYELAHLSNLESLSFTNIKNLESIKEIEHLKSLIYLGLSNTKVTDGDYMPIISNTSLRRVFWFGAPFKSPALKNIKNARPDLVIGGNNAK